MFKKSVLFAAVIGSLALAASAVDKASAFQGPGCMGKCTDCHTLTKDEAGKLIKADKYKVQVKDIRMSTVKGLWEIEFGQGDKSGVVYMDFAKKHLVEGQFTALDKLPDPPTLKKVDPRKIPVDGAVVYGNPKADKKIIVFDDPECPYCAKLHEEIKKIIAKRKDVAFLIKLFPLKIHPEAYEKSKSIYCNGKSAKLLDDSFAGKKLPKANCETSEIDNNIKLAEDLGIRGTPALIFPDGRLMPGYIQADVILNMLDNPQ